MDRRVVVPPWARHRPGDRPLHARRRLIILAAGLFTFVLSLLLSFGPGLVEAAYGETTGPWLARALSAATGPIPFSLTEPLILAFLLWELVPAVLGARAVLRKERHLPNALKAAPLRLGRDVGVLLILFYPLWGFHYARAPLEDRLEFPAVQEADAAELAALALQAIDIANAAYLEIHDVPDAGAATALAPADADRLESSLRTGWRVITAELGLPTSSAADYGRVKRLLATPVFERLGVQGFYFPYTAEANVRAGLPAMVRPVSLGHEMAHQRGYAPEAEANFLGFMAASRAPNVHARYAAFVFAQRHLLLALRRVDRERARQVATFRLPGVQRDIDAYLEYLQRIHGPATDVAMRVNDLYLRSNRVEGGVANYGRVTGLLIAFARSNQDRLRGPHR